MFSPSSLSALELCERKFAWDKVDKIPREPNVYADFGIGTHKRLEDYYKRGVMPDLSDPMGNCAAALLAHLPPPQPGLRIEEHRVHGRFHGYPDLTLGARVWDHKTTSDHKWAKSPEQLLDDLQAALYAHFVMQETGELRVQLQWNYVTRHKPRVLPVAVEATWAKIEPTLARANLLADRGEIILRDQIPALQLAPNPLACDAYGGCVHRNRCNLTAGNRMEGLLLQAEKEENMTSAADFQKHMNANHPPGPPSPPPGNPWDGLPSSHVTETQWYNGTAWVPKAAPPPPPPPPPAAAAVPINPPAPPPPRVVPPADPASGVTTVAAPPPPPVALPGVLDAPAPSAAAGYEAFALACEALAEAARALAGGAPSAPAPAAVPAKRGPGRPRKGT